MKHLFALLSLVALTLTASAQSPKGAEAQSSRPVAHRAPSDVQGKSSLLQSHIKSLGTIGRAARYEVVAIKVRGLDTPNLTSTVIYDSEEDTIVVVGTGSAPGMGVAIVNGAATVSGSYLFGSKIRPNNQNIDNGSTSNSGASANNVNKNTATSSSTSASSSQSNATNNNVNVTTSVNGRPGFIPQGHGHDH